MSYIRWFCCNKSCGIRICAALHENRLFSFFCLFACWWSFVEQDLWLFTVSSDRCEIMDSTLQVGIELKICFYVGLALFQCFPAFCNWFTFWTNYCKIIYSRYCCVPLHHFRARSNFLGITSPMRTTRLHLCFLCCDFFKRPHKNPNICKTSTGHKPWSWPPNTMQRSAE